MRRLRELLLMLVVCQGLATPLSLSGTLGPDGTEEDGNPEVLSSLMLLDEDASDCQVGDGASYRGTVSVTASGKTCQRWDSQEPHEHSRTLANYPSAGLEENYCRNPDGWTEVWCYTTDPDTRWERCDVRDCADWLARDQAWAVGSSGAAYSFGGLTFDAGKVLDGDTSTYWNPYGLERYYNNWYIVLDLRVPYSLFRVGIANYGDDIHDIKAFTLQRSGSGDPYSWENVTSADDIVAGTDEWQERGGFAATARHWRLLISQTHKGWQPWLLELGLYGFRVLVDAPPGYAVFRNNCIRHRNQLGTERDSSVQRCAVSCDLLLACRSFDFNFHHLTCSLSTDTRDSAAHAYENCPARFQQQTDYYEKQDHPQTKDVPAPTYYNPLDHESTFSTPNGHTLDEGVGGSALQLESRRSQYANLGNFAGTCFGSTLNCPRGFTLAFWFKRPAGDNRPQYYINSGGHDFTRTRGFTLTKTVADLDNDLYNIAVNGRLCRHEAKVYLLAEQWTHVAITWLEERGLEIFVDGRVQLVSVLGSEIPPLENDPYTDVLLGSANTQPGQHTGEAVFDELKFWDWVLSDGQLQLAMIPGSVESSVCTDQRDHCQGWAAEGNCNNNYQSYMRQYCPGSCGFCFGPTDSTVNEDAPDETPMMSPERACGDRNQYCVSWASQGYCRTNYAYMVQSCRRACGFCTVTSGGTGGGSMTNTNCMDNHYHCPSWATRGFCAAGNSHHTYMMRYCRKSCRKCGTEGTGAGTGGQGGDCRDTHQHCEDWARRGECTKNPNYMHVRCRPSCGLCTTGGGGGEGGTGGTGSEGGDGDSGEETEMEEEDTDDEEEEEEEEMGEECGMQYLTVSPGIARIVGGKVAVPGAWPWMVFLHRKGYGHLCGGTLISSRWVLTAAHCLTGRTADEINVYLGKHHEDTSDPMEQRFTAKKIILHEGFNLPSYRNDVALIKLPRRAMLNEIANLACLPDGNMAASRQDGSCVTTGWGDTLGTGGEGVLKQLFLPLIPTQKCNSTNFYNGRIHTSMLCAGFEKGGQDSCRGDSGGPLVCSMDGRWYLMGVTSWGRGCALPMRPGVYARVSEFTDWIEKKMLNN